MKLVINFVIAILIYTAICQDEEFTDDTTTKIILDFTTTTLIPKTDEETTPVTTNLASINFDTPEKVIEEVQEAFADLNDTVDESLENFNIATREKLDDESGKIFRDLEREELFNLYQGSCSIDQLTAYEGFQTVLNGLVKLWLNLEHGKIDLAFKQVFKDWIVPFRRDVETTLVTPITSALRFPRGQLDKIVSCANQYTPQILKLIETAFTNVLDCYNMTISYKETTKYADLIVLRYKATAERFTTCNNDPECFRRACPKTYVLVVNSTSEACDAMSSIVGNFQKEVELIPQCARNKFNNASYLRIKDQLRTGINYCLR